MLWNARPKGRHREGSCGHDEHGPGWRLQYPSDALVAVHIDAIPPRLDWGRSVPTLEVQTQVTSTSPHAHCGRPSRDA